MLYQVMSKYRIHSGPGFFETGRLVAIVAIEAA